MKTAPIEICLAHQVSQASQAVRAKLREALDELLQRGVPVAFGVGESVEPIEGQ